MKWIVLGLFAVALVTLGLGKICERTSAGPGHSSDEGIICAVPYFLGFGLFAADAVLAVRLMAAFLRRLFHRHDWLVIRLMGNLWTECAVCRKRRPIAPGDLGDMPAGYPVTERD